MNQSIRNLVVSKLSFTAGSQKADLLNPNITTDNLLGALKAAVDAGFVLLITCVKSDHGNDSSLGPHSHYAGFAVDCWPQNEEQLHDFVQSLCTANKHVIKVGLGGSAQNIAVDPGDTMLFIDNSTDHIHLEVGG